MTALIPADVLGNQPERSLTMRMIACLAVAALWFPFAETPQPAPTLGNPIGVKVIGTAPTPQPDRRCSLPGEMQQCIDYCGRIGGTKRPEPGWHPDDPITLGTRKASSIGPIYAPAQSVGSCDVHTIGTEMVLVCTCFDPGLRT